MAVSRRRDKISWTFKAFKRKLGVRRLTILTIKFKPEETRSFFGMIKQPFLMLFASSRVEEVAAAKESTNRVAGPIKAMIGKTTSGR